MLLLILLSGCLALCAAQTTSFPTSAVPDIPSPSTQPIEATPVLPKSESTGNVILILRARVQSSQELNETTIAPILIRLFSIIQELQPDLASSLTVLNIIKK